MTAGNLHFCIYGTSGRGIYQFMDDQSEAIRRKQMIAYIKSSSGFLSEENKKNILATVLREEGMDSIREYKDRNCTSIDLDLISRKRTLERIYEIARSRRQNISIDGQQSEEIPVPREGGR